MTTAVLRSLLFAGLVTAGCAVARAQEFAYAETAELRGPVQSVRVERADLTRVSGKLVEGSRHLTWVGNYDHGMLRESTINRGDGTPFKKYVARSNPETGTLEESYFHSKGTLEAKFVTTYDRAARKTEVVQYDAKGSVVSRIDYTLDEAGSITEAVRFGKDARTSGKAVTAYDRALNKRETKAYTAAGELVYRTVSTVDANGRTTDQVCYRPEGSPIYSAHHKFDASGSCVDEVYDLGAGGLHYRNDYTYDERGNWITHQAFRQTMNTGLPEYEPLEATYRTITYSESKSAERLSFGNIRGLLLGEAVRQKAPYNPGRTVGTGVAGQISIMLLVDQKGSVLFAQCLTGFEKSMSDLAETVTSRWKYEPALRGGEPVVVLRLPAIVYKPDFR